MNPPPIVRKRGGFPTGIVSTTRFVSGWIRVNTLVSVPVTQTAPSPKATVNEPAGTWISATTLFVAGSILARVPFLSVTSQMLPAPAAKPPSESAIPIGIVAVTFPSLRSTRASVLSPQMGIHKLPKPVARPEQGLFPTVIVPITLLDFGSILATVFFGELETQTDSSVAIQSGAPGTSNTASGFSAVIAIRTPGSFTPGLGARAGLGDCVKEDRRISEIMMSRRYIAGILSNASNDYLFTFIAGLFQRAGSPD